MAAEQAGLLTAGAAVFVRAAVVTEVAGTEQSERLTMASDAVLRIMDTIVQRFAESNSGRGCMPS